ncbi:hypothetical protein [Actinoplanes sp. G11-F43]|uniref:hypothetical protein n=1 Tax=Actinoplanes sp. G11-F43 TaxID=3424130 RepID=UPI003D34FE1C
MVRHRIRPWFLLLAAIALIVVAFSLSPHLSAPYFWILVSYLIFASASLLTAAIRIWRCARTDRSHPRGGGRRIPV